MDVLLIPGIVLFALGFLILLGYLVTPALKWWRGYTKTPADLYLAFLTRCPCGALAFGILLPCLYGAVGGAATGFSIDVNLDFSEYLEAELEEQFLWNVAIEASQEQRRKVIPQEAKDNASGWTARSESSEDGRRLQSNPPLIYQLWKLEIFYEAVDAEKGIFTEEALTEIRDFERSLVEAAGFESFCRRFDYYGSLPCDVPSSVTNLFFTVPNASASGGSTMDIVYDGSGSLANIDSTLRLLTQNEVRWWTDSDFNGRNLKSQFTRSTFLGGAPLEGFSSWNDRRPEQEAKIYAFLGRLFEEYLRQADLGLLPYKHVRFTWYEGRIQNYETFFYLWYDMLFALGTLATVMLLVLARFRNIFVTFFAALGVVLAFVASFYFHYVVAGFTSLTVLDFVSFFVIMGIAADDVFLMYHAYTFAPKVDPRSRMRWAFKEAGAAMLVTSVTTCGSFYANSFSVVKVVRSFGTFMACVVAWNYINVLTIFPSAILVNDLYIMPCLCWKRGATITPKVDSDEELPPDASPMGRFASCIRRCRWLLLFCSVTISLVALFLGVQSFRISEGDVEIFEENVNLGRLQRLRKEIFPDNPGDYDKALSVGEPGSRVRVRACPGQVNNTWCNGQGICDTVVSSCLCFDPFVGQGCSHVRANGSVDLVYYSAREALGDFEQLKGVDYLYVHVLASPLLLEVPANVQGQADFFLLNSGDEAVPWQLEASEVPWLSLSSRGSSVPARSFSRSDQVFLGRDSFQGVLDMSRKAAFWQGNTTLRLRTESRVRDVVLAALVAPPPALTKLSVLADNTSLPLSPAFFVAYGFEGAESRNLALQDLEINYEVETRGEQVVIDAAADIFDLFVDGVATFGPVVVDIPESRDVPIQVVSVFGTTSYTLAVTRNCGGPCTTRSSTSSTATSTTSSRSTRPGETTATETSSTTRTTSTSDFDLIAGAMSLDILNCDALKSDAGEGALTRTVAGIAEVPLEAVRIDLFCNRVAGRRLQMSGADLRYTLATQRPTTFEALTKLRAEDELSMTQRLQASVDEEQLVVQLVVRQLEAVELNPESTTTVTVTSTVNTATFTSTSSRSSSTSSTTGSTSTTGSSSSTTWSSSTSSVTSSISTRTTETTSATITFTRSSTGSSTSATSTSSRTASSSSTSATSTSMTSTSSTRSTSSVSVTSTKTVSESVTATSATSTSETTKTETTTETTSTSASSTETTSSTVTVLTSTSLSTTSSSTSSATGSSSSSTSSSSRTQTSSSSTQSSTSFTSSTTTASSTTSTSSSSTTSSTSSRSSSSTLSTTSFTVTFLEDLDFISGQVELRSWVCDVGSWVQESLATVIEVNASYISVDVSCQQIAFNARRLQWGFEISAAFGIRFPEPRPSEFKGAMVSLQNFEALAFQEALDAKAGQGVLLFHSVDHMSGPVPTSTRTSTTTLCPGSCMGKGSCVSEANTWRCDCEDTYSGLDCSERICPVCNYTSCLEGTQDLDSDWRCEAAKCPGDCNGGGDCNNVTGECTCLLGFKGFDCGIRDVPLSNAVEIVLVFGLKGYAAANRSAPDYDESVDLFQAAAQAHFLETCTRAREIQDLRVKEEQPCWIEVFANFVRARGGDFPVNDARALAAFMFLRDAEDLGYSRDVRTSGEAYDGRVMFSRLRMKVNVARNGDKSERQALREAWQEYVKDLNSRAPPEAGNALMVSLTWTSMELEDRVFSSTVLAFSLSIGTSLVAVSIFTQNIILAIYVCLTIILVVCVLSGCLLSALQYDFGVVEAIGATIFVGLSVDYCLHLAHGYHHALGNSRAEKLNRALTSLTPSIAGGALTTIAACVFLLPCRMILFRKLGWTLVLNAAISITFTYTFLAPLLLIAGPRGGRSTVTEVYEQDEGVDNEDTKRVNVSPTRLGKSPEPPLAVESASET